MKTTCGRIQVALDYWRRCSRCEQQAMLFVAPFLLFGFVQAAAVVCGLLELGYEYNVIFIPVGCALAFVPMLGTVLGIVGAIEGWGWSSSVATWFFMAPYLFGLLIAIYETYVPPRR